MEEELFKLSLSDNLEELSKFIDKKKDDEVVSAVSKCVQQGKRNANTLIKCVLKVSKAENSQKVDLCTKLYKKLFQVLQKNEINDKDALCIVSLLLIEVDGLQTEILAKLARYFVESIKDGSFASGKGSDLFPKILCVINTTKEIHNGEDCIKGSEFKSHIINSLCSSRWKPSTAVVMATLLHDIPLTGDELKFVINKIIRLFPEIELSDQPALVFQLLQLSSKGHKNLVLEGITNYYKAEDDKQRGKTNMIDSEDMMSDSTCLTTLRQVEGTVILHIVQAVKQDQELGRELIKYFKVLQLSDALKTITPFNLLLLLSVSQLHHCEDQINDFVKSTIFKCIRDEMRQQRSLWIQECFPINIKTTELVLEAVDHSTYDWDHVIQSLVQLGFDLLESYGPRLVFGQMPEAPTPDENHMTPQQLACKLGRRLLLKTFKAHEMVRTEILDEIFKNIITRATQPVTHYLDLLSDTVYSAPQLLLQSSTKIQRVLLELAHLPPATAHSLLSSVQPLLKLSPLLKDSLLLVLRKAMFSRQLDSRKIGAMGFLIILKNFRVVGGLPSSQVSQPFALSQIQVEVHARYNAASNEALCLEILGNLRRCFTQQADVRLSVYQGLFEVLHRNSQLRNPVLDMLLSQIMKYYDQNEDNSPPLRLEPTVQIQGEQVYLLEPLSHLLRCVQQCVRKSVTIASQMSNANDEDDDDENTELALVQLKSIMTSLVKRMIDAGLEDFELDKNSDFSLANSVGMKNNIYAIHLLGVYEILMEYVSETGNFSLESCTLICQLFSCYSKLALMVKDKLGGKRGKPSASKTAMSLMSVQCVINLLKAFIDNHNTAHEEGINVLRQNKDLFPHLVSVALQKLEQVASKGFPEGEMWRKEKVFNDCCILGRLFYLHYVENQIANEAAGDREKNATSQCLEALSLVIHTASAKGDQAIFHCLSHLEKEMEEDKQYVREEQVIGKVHTHIKKLQRLVATILNESRDLQNWKEMSTLLSVISQLTSHLPGHSEQSQQIQTWLVKVATDEDVEDASCCKQLISSLLTGGKTKSLPQLLLNLCQDLHSQFGHIDKDCEVEGKTHYSVTKSSNCPPSSILMLVLAQMDVEIDDVDWAIRKHKALVAVSASTLTLDDDDGVGATQMEQMDRSLCTRLGMLVNGFVELCHSAITAKVNSHALLKSLTKLYTTLSNLAKFYLGLYTSKSGHMGSRFEKLIKLVGRQLTQPAYCIISYVEMTESVQNSVDGKKKDKGKKDGTNAAQTGMAKAMKQMKLTSNLIFAIEQLEKFIIQLSKKSKVNLMEDFKLSTSRDFRITADVIAKAVDEGVSSSDEGDDQEEENEQENVSKANSESEEDNSDVEKDEVEEEEPPAKKSKLGQKKKGKA